MICTLHDCSLGQIKKIPVFRVTRPYLNLLLKPRFFLGFLEKLNFMHFERRLESAGYVICSFSRYRHITKWLYQISSYLNDDFELWSESRFHL